MAITVAFSDQSTPGPSGPITAWAWDFGDGGTSTAENPTHNYAVADTYSVSLTVTGTGADGTVSITKPVIAIGPGALTALFNSSGSALIITFTDESSPGPSGPITAWNWDFGDGGTSTSQNPVHTYASPGTYTVTLTVTGTSPDGTASYAPSLTVPASAPSAGIYWGLYENGPATMPTYYGSTDPHGVNWRDGPASIPFPDNTWDRVALDAGKVPSLLHYGVPFPSNAPFDAATASGIIAKGCIPIIDTGEGVTLAAVAAGTYDAALTTWAHAVATWGHPFFWRPWWEMNGGWYPWGTPTPAATYVAAWQHMHGVIAPIAPNVTWCWCPNIGIISEANARYPGDAYVDWTGLDGYNNKTALTHSFSSIFGSSYANLRSLAPSKPIVIVETASQEYGAGAKASWITDALTTQLPTNFTQIKGVCWFNWNEAVPTNAIESSPSALSAFATAVGASYYKAGGSFSLPSNAKVPIPA